MAATHSQLLRYLRECYRENGSRGGLWNLFGRSVSHRLFLEEKDVLASRSDLDDPFYVRAAEAGETAQQAALRRKEKDLVYASIFLVGTVERFDGKPESVCAPLFLFPASLETDGLAQGAHLSVDLSRRQVNYPVLEAAGGETFARQIELAVEPNDLTEGCVGEVRRRFTEAFPDASTDSLLNYPCLVSEKELRQRARSATRLALIPAAAIALVNKSTEMRGVLNELDAMATESDLSAPVRSLFGDASSPSRPTKPGRIPATLSAAQQKVVTSASRHALTLAIGPPGTGKSFTIAALALETLSKGGSVLIASKMDHAVDVVGEKIEAAIGLEGVVTRGGRRHYLRDLKQFIEDLLAGIHTATWPSRTEILNLSRGLQKADKEIERLAKKLRARLDRETEWGELFADTHPGWWAKLRQGWLRRRLESLEPAWSLARRLENGVDRRQSMTVDFLRQSRSRHLALALQQNRNLLKAFSRAIRARTGHRQAQYFEEMGLRNLLGALPIWLVNLSDAHRILPLEAEAFDLAIIDEATQCDIASALPVLQRARRAVITGDPKQLRHLSFLPRDRQASLGLQHELTPSQQEQFDFREISLLDLASEVIDDQDRVVFLNEHFRSQPEIIDFSNREFYGNNLHVMTTLRSPHGAPTEALRLSRVEDGKREPDGSNPIEAGTIIANLLAVAEAQRELPDSAVHRIGVLSPFRGQVEFLRTKIAANEAACSLLQRHDLLIGTAHSFQGEERDLMFLSLALDDASPAASFRFLEKPDVFNVAVTRARLLNHTWHSFSPTRLNPDSLLARYLAHAGAPGAKEDPLPDQRSAEHDRFSAEVQAFLEKSGATVILEHPLAGMRVDLVYHHGGIYRGIDLVGFPGAMADAFPLERVLTFRRAGLPILPLPFSAWLTHRDRCENWLLDRRSNR